VVIEHPSVAGALHALVNIEVQNTNWSQLVVFAGLVEKVQLLAADLEKSQHCAFAAEKERKSTL